ncbi:MAG: prolyl oligopeptidase family serine peptidase [Akkermansiaceae bacterium]
MKLIIPALSFSVIFADFTSAQQDDLDSVHQSWVKASQSVRSMVKNSDPKIKWQQDSVHYIYREDTSDGWQWMTGSVENNPTKPAFDHLALAKALSNKLNKKIPPHKLDLQELVLHEKDISFRFGNQWYRFSGDQVKATKPIKRPSKQRHEISSPRPTEKSPDGKWRAFVKDGTVLLTNTKTKETRTIGKAAQKDHSYVGKPTWNLQSTHFYLYYLEPGQRRMVTLVESSPKDQLQPKLHHHRYDKPGDKIDRYEPHVFSINNQSIRKPDRKLTANAMSTRYAQWSDDGQSVVYEYVERGYGKHYLIAMDANSGDERPLAKEESETFIFTGFIRFRKHLPKTNEIIWGSERSGWRHLYLLDSKTGKVKNPITQGNWVVRKVIDVDTKKRQIIFTANGVNPDEDPYHIHWYRVQFDGKGMTVLTEGKGTHDVVFSPDGKHYIDSWSRVDQPTVHEMRRASDGKKIREIIRTDASQITKSGRKLPERFVSKDRNGRFDIHGIIITPPNFDPKKKYPIVEHIYAGPHSAYTPKKFKSWQGVRSDMAEEGFIVVQLDALGTNYRHRDFSHFAYRNLVDSGLPDRIKWIKDAAKTRPWMDTSRVGIYGGSAGGQSSTAAVLHHGEFYKAAVSDCGCHDNRMDKIWWNEQWMDWPIDSHYAEQSNITNAHKLTGALMLTVGELDKNVDPASTTQLVDALLKAKKTFTYFIVPGAGHGVGERSDMRVRRALFFKKHLGNAR